MARSRLADQVGRVVGGRYRLLAPVGTGASADVYVADDVTLRRRVAVKVLHEALASDEGFLRRFRAEARAVASLRHPNIMAVFDWGQDGDVPYLVLEYLGGGSLRDLLDRGHRLSPSQAVLVGLEAARGLDYAHRRGLVHRDVKPANLLFDDEGRLVIADFGIARALAEATWTEPAGAVVGTVRYASPEQARGNSIDGRADVYALALVLAEAVTGSVPFASDTTIATLMGRLDRPIPAADELGALGPVITAAGTVDPVGRLDAAGLVQALDGAAHHLPRPAPLPLSPIEHLPLPEQELHDSTTAFAPLSPLPPAPPKPPAPANEPQPAPPVSPTAAATDRRHRHWRLPWIAIGVIAVAVAVVASILLGPTVRPTYAVPSLKDKPIADVLSARYPHFKILRHDVREGQPEGTVRAQRPVAGVKARPGTITVDVSIGFPIVKVASLINLTPDQARAVLAQQQLQMTVKQAFSSTIGAGHVVSWSPIDAEQTSTVTVTESVGPQVVPMPNVVNQPVAQATATLQAAGLTAAAPSQDYSDTVPAGNVISTTPAPGSPADRTQPVTVDVSKGPQTVKVPNVIGDSVSQAEAAIQAAGLAVGNVAATPGASQVVAQRPSGGTVVKKGSSVSIAAF